MDGIMYYNSPVGMLRIESSGDAVTRLVIVGPDAPEQGRGAAATPVLSECAAQLDAYFAGTRTAFDIKLDLAGTDFQRRVWAALSEIPYGETRSYGDVAAAIGNPKAVRAVGGANRHNPVWIIVPCHRVINTGGKLGGYGGGLENKAWLLEHERRGKSD